MKHIILLISLLFVLSSTQLFAKKFVVGVDPWLNFIIEKDGKYSGKTIDIFSELADKMGYEIEFKSYPWARCIQSMKDGTVDAIGNLSYAKKREKFLTYVKPPFYNQKILFYVLKGNENLINKHEDLYKHSIPIGNSYVFYKKFDEDPKLKKVTISRLDLDSPEELSVDMLLKKRVKVIIGYSGIMEDIFERKNAQSQIVPANFDPNQNDLLHIGISNKSPFIKDIKKINEAMREIINK